MNAYDRLPDAVAVAEIFGEEATAERAYELLTVDVPAASWITALETARSTLGCTFFDWLSAVDEGETGFRVCAHVVSMDGGRVRRLLVRTTIPHEAAVLPTAIGVYAGAEWHERETYEMFGISFTGHPHLVHLLLPEAFEGHPLRKDFVLAARVVKAWPGAKEPGESEHGGPRRRQMLPPGVPDPNEWGPLKGQLPPGPARPARGARAAGERPARRARSVSEGSTSQTTPTPGPAGAGETAPETSAPSGPRPSDAPWHSPKPAVGGGDNDSDSAADSDSGGSGTDSDSGTDSGKPDSGKPDSGSPDDSGTPDSSGSPDTHQPGGDA